MTAIASVERGRPKRRFTPWTNPYIEALAMFVWFFTTAYRYNHDTEVLYLLCGYFLVGVYVHRAQVLPLMARGWPILLLPPWVLLTTLWSAVPMETFKYALQGILCVVICFYIASRISIRTFISALVVALTFYEVMSIPRLGDYNFAGVMFEKNFFAYRMSTLVFAALVVLLDKQYPRYLRIAAGPIAALALFMIYKSHSATSFVVGLMGIGVIFGAAWIWGPARGYRAFIIAIAVALVAGVALYLYRDPNFNAETWLLNALGKDSTLTGRQELWDYAGKLIEQKPLLGMGFGSFWLPERVDAQALLDSHFKPRGIPFLFHNSYIELTVYSGYIGLTLGLIGWIWSFGANMGRVLARGTVATAFFATIGIIALARSYVESDLWQPFDYAQMIIWIGAIYPWAREQSAVRRYVVPASIGAS